VIECDVPPACADTAAAAGKTSTVGDELATSSSNVFDRDVAGVVEDRIAAVCIDTAVATGKICAAGGEFATPVSAPP
jgi:hypothetical protein